MPTKRTVLLTLPWPPSLNKLYRAYGGRVILSKPARAYYGPAGNAIIRQLGSKPRPLTGRLAVYAVLHAPAKLVATGQVWDIANRDKLLFDVCTKYRVWIDDEQIDALLLARGRPNLHGNVDILITEC